MGYIKMNFRKNKTEKNKPQKPPVKPKHAQDADPAESAEDITRKPAYTETSSTIMAVMKAVLYICFIIIAAGTLAYFAINFVNDMYAFVKNSEEVEIEVPEYASADDISEILGDGGVIKYPWLFRLYAKLKHVDDLIAANPESYAFVAGTHTVNGMMNYDELIIALRPKSTRSTIRLTIPEGYNVEDIINLFTSNGIGTREGFIDAINNGEYDFDFVRAIDMNDGSGRHYRLEGYLYPDTYDFYTDNSESYYIYKLLDRFEEVYSKQLREYTEKSGFTVDQIVTIASIIEKEAYYASDYDKVSAVIHNRLAKPASYPNLECDATTIYAWLIARGEKPGELTAEQLNLDNPYNTYVAKGLPPGAICNPSYQALTCALSPDTESSNYFFVTDTNLFMLYAETRAGHERNVALVRQHREQEAASGTP